MDLNLLFRRERLTSQDLEDKLNPLHANTYIPNDRPRAKVEAEAGAKAGDRLPWFSYFLRVPKGVAGVCHCCCDLARLVMRAAAAGATQPLVIVVGVLKKPFDPMAAGA